MKNSVFVFLMLMAIVRPSGAEEAFRLEHLYEPPEVLSTSDRQARQLPVEIGKLIVCDRQIEINQLTARRFTQEQSDLVDRFFDEKSCAKFVEGVYAVTRFLGTHFEGDPSDAANEYIRVCTVEVAVVGKAFYSHGGPIERAEEKTVERGYTLIRINSDELKIACAHNSA